MEAGTRSSVLVFSYNYSIISLLIACPSLVDEFVFVITAYWNALCFQCLPLFPCESEIFFSHSPCVDCTCRSVKDDHNPRRQVCQTLAKIAAKHQFCNHICGSSWPQVQLIWLQSQECSVKGHPCLQNHAGWCRAPATQAITCWKWPFKKQPPSSAKIFSSSRCRKFCNCPSNKLFTDLFHVQWVSGSY